MGLLETISGQPPFSFPHWDSSVELLVHFHCPYHCYSRVLFYIIDFQWLPSLTLSPHCCFQKHSSENIVLLPIFRNQDIHCRLQWLLYLLFLCLKYHYSCSYLKQHTFIISRCHGSLLRLQTRCHGYLSGESPLRGNCFQCHVAVGSVLFLIEIFVPRVSVSFCLSRPFAVLRDTALSSLPHGSLTACQPAQYN